MTQPDFTPGDPGTELKMELRDDITNRAIAFHYAMRAVNRCQPGQQAHLDNRLEEAGDQLHVAVERLDMLARHTAKLNRQ